MVLRGADFCCVTLMAIASAMNLFLEQSGLKSGQQSPVKERGDVRIRAEMISFMKNVFIIVSDMTR